MWVVRATFQLPDTTQETVDTACELLEERIETPFSQLHNSFVDRVYSRSFHGLWNTGKLKILHLNFCHKGFLIH